MPTLDEQYQQLVTIAREDKGVVAFVLGGGRGKGISTENSDYDILIITEDEVVEGVRVKYQGYAGPKFDITVMSRRELSIYGVWGSDTMWARYGFAHVKAVFDKGNEIQRWLDDQEMIPAQAIDDAIKQVLDNYLNYTHRSLKNFRDVRRPAAHMAACDGIPQLIAFLFAAEGRVRPYNEYIEWELEHHPLRTLAMNATTFNQKIGMILASGDEATQKEFLALAQSIAQKSRVGADVLKSWDGYYFG
jgi:hypothetical protein